MNYVREYTIHSLDVWGNETDGFQVNDIYPSSGTVQISDQATDREILEALKDEGHIRRGVLPSQVRIDGEPGFSLWVEDARNGRPELELRAKST